MTTGTVSILSCSVSSRSFSDSGVIVLHLSHPYIVSGSDLDVFRLFIKF